MNPGLQNEDVVDQSMLSFATGQVALIWMTQADVSKHWPQTLLGFGWSHLSRQGIGLLTCCKLARQLAMSRHGRDTDAFRYEALWTSLLPGSSCRHVCSSRAAQPVPGSIWPHRRMGFCDNSPFFLEFMCEAPPEASLCELSQVQACALQAAVPPVDAAGHHHHG